MNASRSLPPVEGHESNYHYGETPMGYYEKPKTAGESSASPWRPQTPNLRSFVFPNQK